MDELVSAGNAPFLVAICLMAAIGVIEGLSLLIGVGLSHYLDSVLAPDVDHGPDFSGGDFLGWLHVGRAPILVLVVIFLAGFAIAGLIIQWMATGLVGQPLPAFLASLLALACAVPTVHVLGGRLARLVPKDETFVVSEESFVGRVARLTAASAGAGSPGEAKLTDEHGRTHYLLVEPDGSDIQFKQGDALLVVSRKSGSVFRAIHNPRPDLL
ncbi:MAG: YqiJ family protein [Alphaproteobacteria bacterium]|nr:YqiJ family protein [Alphaproteobacteria bacterium]